MKHISILIALLCYTFFATSIFAETNSSPASSPAEVKNLEDQVKAEISESEQCRKCTYAKADNYPIIKVQYGLGIGDIKDGDILNGAERSMNVGYYNKLNKVLGWDFHLGFVSAEDVESYFGFLQFGSELHPFDWMYVDHYFGPGYVRKGNSKISEGLNFSMHMGIGWRDPQKGTTVGMNWKHISNAGIREPNKGMDFVLVQVGIPL